MRVMLAVILHDIVVMKERWDIEKEGFDFQSWGLFLTAAVIGWLILGMVLEQQGPQQLDLSSKAPLAKSKGNIIDRHLAHTSKQLELAKIEAKIHNLKSSKINDNEIGPIDLMPDPVHSPGVDLAEETPAEDVMRDIKGIELPERATPGDRIRLQLARRNWMARYDREYRRGLVREVKRKAREEGFLIEFDDELNVMSVKEYKPKLPQEFEVEE